MKKIYAVIDTNVLVSALLTKNAAASTVKLLSAIKAGLLVPLYNDEIIDEYREVLKRPKFRLEMAEVISVLSLIDSNGVSALRVESDELFPDPKDVVFYEVALSHDGAFLVTGNCKHFPKKPIVVTPAEMLRIMEETFLCN